MKCIQCGNLFMARKWSEYCNNCEEMILVTVKKWYRNHLRKKSKKELIDYIITVVGEDFIEEEYNLYNTNEGGC